jgi:Ca2+-binding RTX toxin-like protein
MAVGWHNVPDIQDTQIELLRLTANGALDSTFSGDGRVTIKDSTFDRAESLYIRPDNSILIGGDVITLSVVFSLSSGGQLDSNFGLDGQLFFVGTGISAIQLQQGKILTIQTAPFRSTAPKDLQAIRFGNDNITLTNGTLSIAGTSKNDRFFVAAEETEYSVSYNGANSVYATSAISRVDIEGVGGDDDIGFDQIAVPGTVSGGSGNDTIRGLNGEAVSSGMALSGGDGDDIIDVSTNPSLGLQLDGGNGNDLIKGTNAPDSITGGAGKDTIFGEAGNDRISSGGGKDHINAGTGNDRIYGGAGDDQLDGGPGNDRIFGQEGNDKLFGGKGNDALDGGAGSDLLVANAGDDELFSNDGQADRLDGGSGNNTATIDDGIDSTIRIQTLL